MFHINFLLYLSVGAAITGASAVAFYYFSSGDQDQNISGNSNNLEMINEDLSSLLSNQEKQTNFLNNEKLKLNELNQDLVGLSATEDKLTKAIEAFGKRDQAAALDSTSLDSLKVLTASADKVHKATIAKEAKEKADVVSKDAERDAANELFKAQEKLETEKQALLTPAKTKQTLAQNKSNEETAKKTAADQALSVATTSCVSLKAGIKDATIRLPGAFFEKFIDTWFDIFLVRTKKVDNTKLEDLLKKIINNKKEITTLTASIPGLTQVAEQAEKDATDAAKKLSAENVIIEPLQKAVDEVKSKKDEHKKKHDELIKAAQSLNAEWEKTKTALEKDTQSHEKAKLDEANQQFIVDLYSMSIAQLQEKQVAAEAEKKTLASAEPKTKTEELTLNTYKLSKIETLIELTTTTTDEVASAPDKESLKLLQTSLASTKEQIVIKNKLIEGSVAQTEALTSDLSKIASEIALINQETDNLSSQILLDS